MKPIRNWLVRPSRGTGGAAVEGVTGVAAGTRAASKRVDRFRILASNGRSDEDRVYIDGTCRLNATIIWPLEDTGFAFSRYAVKLSSRQRTSACVEPGGKIGVRDEFGVVCEAVATMPHIGHPAFGAKEAIFVVDDNGEVEKENGGSL